jgi:hypothetical protein
MAKLDPRGFHRRLSNLFFELTGVGLYGEP